MKKTIQCSVDLDVTDIPEDDIERLVRRGTALGLTVSARYRSSRSAKISVDFGSKLESAQAFVNDVDGLRDSYGEDD
ncbi:hypothetical protein [Streptomyces sp. AK08-02]|uniref:hypothetical protein n=1 Tax=Streptomyces sp. AK08-02 TaxID=3028654 RepID=UPI0029A1EBCD|nr:hypothetical protein [Streptomyces sp. AK08-02]MDX3747435.1 hypothetical protein [Streptomyces sp. AK08-02]